MAAVLLLAVSNVPSLVSLSTIGINYQTVLRDAQGNLLQWKAIDVKFELVVQGQTQPAYIETHNSLSTDDLGSFNAIIGNGTRDVSSVAFSALDFRSNWYRIHVYYKLNPHDSWTLISDQLLEAVPYALNVPDPVIGSVISFAGKKEYFEQVLKPQGWRLCNGDELDTGSSPANRSLFKALGYSWG
jgi:hypothetical protein